MPSPTKGARLGGSPADQRLMLANLATSLFAHGRITTTEAKARRLRPVRRAADHQGQAWRPAQPPDIMRVIRDKTSCTASSPRSARSSTPRGGYTRITKTLPRKGDNAPMAIIG